MKCIECWNEDITLMEWFWAYDWWLAYDCKECNNIKHRIDNKIIIEEKQSEQYWPVYFKTETGFFRNLREITEDEFTKVI